jgi:hypothetical protein
MVVTEAAEPMDESRGQGDHEHRDRDGESYPDTDASAARRARLSSHALVQRLAVALGECELPHDARSIEAGVHDRQVAESRQHNQMQRHLVVAIGEIVRALLAGPRRDPA